MITPTHETVLTKSGLQAKPGVLPIDEIKVDANGVIGGGPHLKPHEVNDLVEKYGDNVVFYIDEENGVHIQININCISDVPVYQ